jgi:hypothetical protein
MEIYQKGLEAAILSLGSRVYKDFDRFLRVSAAHPLDPAHVIKEFYIHVHYHAGSPPNIVDFFTFSRVTMFPKQ